MARSDRFLKSARPAVRRSNSASDDRPRLLVIEPNPLARWAMSSYLDRWFRPLSVESAEQAETVLAAGGVDAIVVSDDVPREDLHEIEARARKRNQDVRIVHTVCRAELLTEEPPETFLLEKPFDLVRLARMLGIDPGSPGGAE